MKVTIGQNISKLRKDNGLTQAELAEKLNVSVQAISKWENDISYPDIERIGQLAYALNTSAEAIINRERITKLKQDNDLSKRILSISIKHTGDDPVSVTLKIPCELALKSHNDGSLRALMGGDYGDEIPESVFEMIKNGVVGSVVDVQIYRAFVNLLYHRNLIKWGVSDEEVNAAEEFMEKAFSVIRCDGEDDSPDMWVDDRLSRGFNRAISSAKKGKYDEAISKLEPLVRLLERTMKITNEVALPTSCRFLDGMIWTASESWHHIDNNPDSPMERMIYIRTQMSGMTTCYCIYPSVYYNMLQGKYFDPVRGKPEFTKLCERVKDLIVTK